MNALANVGNQVTEKIATQNHASYPQDAARYVVSEITGVRHGGGAGHGGTKGSNDRDESGEDDGLAAVLFVEISRAFEMASFEEERVFAFIKRSAGSAPNPVANLITHDGAEHRREKHFGERDVPCGGKDSRGYQEGVAGKKETNEKAGLDENNHANDERSPWTSLMNQSLNIVNGVEQVTDGFEQATWDPLRAGYGEDELELIAVKAPHPIR